MKRSLFLLVIIVLAFGGCKKIRYSGFTIKAIETFKLPSAPDNSVLQFKVEGPGMNEITEWRSYSSSTFITTDFQGDKAKKDYDLTLIRKTDNVESEVSKMTIDFGDYLNQDAFFLENDDMRIKLYVEWNGRW